MFYDALKSHKSRVVAGREWWKRELGLERRVPESVVLDNKSSVFSRDLGGGGLRLWRQ